MTYFLCLTQTTKKQDKKKSEASIENNKTEDQEFVDLILGWLKIYSES